VAAVRCRSLAIVLFAVLSVDACHRISADGEPQNWPSSGRDAAGTYFSPLTSINESNVRRLGLAWEYRLGTQRGLEATPIVVDGTLFTSGNWGRVYALDAATGRERWTFIPDVNAEYARRACCDAVNRGVAVWHGNVYVATLDGYLYALNAETGAVRWKADTFVDRTRSYTSTGAPQIAGHVVVIGNAGADLNVRGYLSAYDLVTGQLSWRFFTVPRDPRQAQDHPDLEQAVKTWDPHSLWSFGGGGTVWDSMLFDPKLNLLFVGTGNSAPYPVWQRSPAGGDNLYLASILAIDPDSGRLKWFYQTVPAESWDYTATAKMVMADITLAGRLRHVLMQAPKNGFFYVLDRQTGELLAADKYVAVNWADHVDLKSRY
jgi:quinohemoprotein ethanol dehydrogenase